MLNIFRSTLCPLTPALFHSPRSPQWLNLDKYNPYAYAYAYSTHTITHTVGSTRFLSMVFGSKSVNYVNVLICNYVYVSNVYYIIILL